VTHLRKRMLEERELQMVSSVRSSNHRSGSKPGIEESRWRLFLNWQA
jgi:hypothetical protein